MNVTGIIAEYNPFHKGHLYQINKIKERDNSFIIIIMSGDFLQRGTPAILDKWTRARMALSSGADLVIELPTLFATASAQYFARGGVSILDKLGVVNNISFGCETDNLSLLNKTASFLWKEPTDYQKKLQSLLKEGNSFPKAREEALTSILGKEAASIVSSPNNILALEYCIALLERNSSIQPLPVLRKGNGYHEDTLMRNSLPSASAIRNRLLTCAYSSANKSDIDALHLELAAHLPTEAASILTEKKENLLLSQDALSLLLKYKLLSGERPLAEYADVTPELADKIAKNLNQYKSFSQFIELLKSKDLTYARINRALTHILLNMTQNMYTEVKENDYAAYARVLGFHNRALPLLSEIGKHTSIPLITKLGDAKKQLSQKDYEFFEHDIFCSHLYESIIADKTNLPFQNEYKKQVIILEDK